MIPADHCARLPFPARTFRFLESAAWDVLLCASSSVRGCCGTAGPAAAGARTPAGAGGGGAGGAAVASDDSDAPMLDASSRQGLSLIHI